MVARSVQPWRGSPASGTANEVRAITSPITFAVTITIAGTGVVAATVIAVASVVATAVIAVAVPISVVPVAVIPVPVAAVTVITVTVPVVAVPVVAVAVVAVAVITVPVVAVATIAITAAAVTGTAIACVAAVGTAATAVAVSAVSAIAVASTTHRRRLCVAQGRCHVHREGSGPVQGGLRYANPQNNGESCNDRKIDSDSAIVILLEFLEKRARTCRPLGLAAAPQQVGVPELIGQCILPFKHARDTQTARDAAFQLAC